MVDCFSQVEVTVVGCHAIGLHGKCASVGLGSGMDKVGETTRSIQRDSEMTSKRWTKRGRSSIRVDLVIDQTPLLQKPVNSHDRADITGQISSTCRDGQVLSWVESVGVDHEVAIVFVDGGCFASVSAGKELW